MKQSDDPKAFFEKYGFTRTVTILHPIYKDEMHFEGLEAEYVNRLEMKISDLQDHLQRMWQKVDHLTSLEQYRLRDEIKKKEFEK